MLLLGPASFSKLSSSYCALVCPPPDRPSFVWNGCLPEPRPFCQGARSSFLFWCCRDDMVQAKLEGIHLQKCLKAIATPANKNGTTTNNAPPQPTISFKKMKPGSQRKAAPVIKKALFATTHAATVCGLCQETGHEALNCE